MGCWRFLKETLGDGGPGFCQFAITNACNARCAFCNFALGRLAPADLRQVTLDEARDAIDVLARNRIGYLVFVGGEPLVHPDLREMIRYTHARGVSPMVCTNGSRLTPEWVDGLVKDGLSSCIISIDAPSAMVHEQNRGLPNVCRRIREANARFRTLGIQTTASVTVSRLIDDYRTFPAFLSEMGFSSVTFSYPLTSLPSSYLSFSESSLVAYSNDELLQVFEEIKKVSRHFHVVNPRASIEDMQRHLRGERERFECLAGYKYFHLDWNLDLYRCHYWDRPMCKVGCFDGSQRVRDGCTKCMIDCYRDPSVLQHIAISVSDAIRNARRGRVLRALQILCRWSNVISIRSVLESARWIRRV
jgi:MoaA/NifB/PqqE/SkfB family radical SAM enzyme